MSGEGAFPQLIATGIMTGAIYALVGLGLTLVYSTTRVINIAIGDFAALGALTAVSLTKAGVPPFPAYVVAIFVGGLVGAATYVIAIRPAQRREGTVLTLLIVTIALHLAFVGAAALIWGTESFVLPEITAGEPVELLSARVTRQAVWIVAVAALIFIALWAFFSRLTIGKALRACAINPLGARITGIPVARMGLLAFSLGALLAAAAGVLFAPETLATYNMGLSLSLAAFVGAVMGNLRSYPGTVAGCMLLGLLESLAAGILPSGYRDGVAFVLLIAILLWRALPSLRGGVLVAEESGRA